METVRAASKKLYDPYEWMTEQERGLMALLAKSYGLDPAEAARHADDIRNSYNACVMVQRLDHEARKPADDQESLKKAANHIRLALDNVSELGWYGRDALPSLRGLLGVEEPAWMTGSTDFAELTAFLSTLSALGVALSAAAGKIDTEAPPPMTMLGDADAEFRGRGRRREIAKEQFAQSLAESFFKITKKKPTFHKDRVDRKPKGDFFPFMCAVFAVFKLSGNEDNLAEQACSAFDDAFKAGAFDEQALAALEADVAAGEHEALVPIDGDDAPPASMPPQ